MYSINDNYALGVKFKVVIGPNQYSSLQIFEASKKSN